MRHMKAYIAAGYNTLYFGSGRPEFDPKKPMPTFDTYLKETAQGTIDQCQSAAFDEGIIGSFMPARFINQANLPGFLPYMVPSLLYKPCTGVEGACGTGGRAIAAATRSVLSGMSDTTFVTAFEIQNTLKSIYGADVLAGAGYYQKERKQGHSYFFPGVFSDRAGAYYEKYGYDTARSAMAQWYEQMILNARKYPKAQEYHNSVGNLYELGMTSPDPTNFVPHLNHYDCSKVSDGASSLLVLTEDGLKKCGIEKKDALEIIALGEAQGDITQSPADLLELTTTKEAVAKALAKANLTMDDIGILEIHDCFTITAILAFEAMGLAPKGEGTRFILQGNTTPSGRIPTNLSGGLIGFGHPTGATGVRQMVDLLGQLTGKAENQVQLQKPYGMMISMGGNDKTVTCIIVKRAD